MSHTWTLASRGFSRLRTNGLRDVNQRLARRFTHWIATEFRTADLDFPLLAGDIADSRVLTPGCQPHGRTDGPLRIAWLCTPPAPGSGGHTTLFRMVEGLEHRGHSCTVLLYNRHGSNLDFDTSIIRRHWPHMSAEIRYVPDRLDGYDVCFASSWETAHVLARRGNGTQHRIYFIQDYEPFFYPRGSLYALAEDTYRFGFRHIAVGNMVQELLLRETGANAAVAPFGCDTGVYTLKNFGPRSGVAFFSRPGVDRRGSMLAQLALAEFHRRHPDQPITVFGDRIAKWDVPHRYVGKLSPAELNVLYNKSAAGLALSFTNVSLVPEEMLAAGMQPVANDSPLARMGLPNRHVRWAPPTPAGLADALSRAVMSPLNATDLAALAASARSGWGPAQAAVAAEIELAVYGHRPGFPVPDVAGLGMQEAGHGE
ncbi:glycosyltransferase family 1 protein [Arthrobacter sp. CDRTa11]|uniref:rhamnosyltransferase WsaF family glycosyltransferase n=1 Tax=Arthrobacter sp. CDRTa11 TaxID=2651199 RepID=UPI0022659239|nr:glycosyltransferase family 1 protein [Arthrobacter sp. CDRTa11]